MEGIMGDFYTAVNHSRPARVPVVVWGPTAPFVTTMTGTQVKDYYLNSEGKLQIQQKFLRMFPEAIGMPGLWPDFGAVGLPSTMGCPVIWLDDDAPVARPMLSDIKEVLTLKIPDPKVDGCLAVELKQWEYFQQHADRDLVEKYGYLDGTAYVLGPVETAGLMRGYTDFFMDLYLNPELVHKLLEINTEVAINYLHECEKINGRLKRLAIGDHVPTQICPEHFKEFWLPYMSRIFQEFSYAEIRLWHNEGSSKHVYPFLKDLGANVWHLGDDPISDAKANVGDFFCLMGNVHPVNELVNGNYESVLAAGTKVIRDGSQGGGLWLSSGGGLAPNTPMLHLQALIDAAKAERG